MSKSRTVLHLLLLLSLAVCSLSEARPIGVLEKRQEPAAPENSRFSGEDVEKSSVHARVSVSSNAKPSNQNEPQVVEKMDGTTQPVEHEDEHELEDDRRNHDTARSESVSWNLPNPNAEERQPGSFNQLDYDPPRTHPPSHN